MGEGFSTDYGQFFENFTGDEIVTWGFFWIEVINGCLDISSCEAVQASKGSPDIEEWFLLPQMWDRRGKVEIRRLDVVKMHELFQWRSLPKFREVRRGGEDFVTCFSFLVVS
jgi:hypothetical protein